MAEHVLTTATVDGKPVTADENGVPTSAVNPKVTASAAGAGLGAAVSTIGIYLIETLGNVDLPVAVDGAILVLVSYGVSFLTGYLKRPAG